MRGLVQFMKLPPSMLQRTCCMSLSVAVKLTVTDVLAMC